MTVKTDDGRCRPKHVVSISIYTYVYQNSCVIDWLLPSLVTILMTWLFCLAIRGFLMVDLSAWRPPYLVCQFSVLSWGRMTWAPRGSLKMQLGDKTISRPGEKEKCLWLLTSWVGRSVTDGARDSIQASWERNRVYSIHIERTRLRRD